MAALIVLLTSLVLVRGLGISGVDAVATWQGAAVRAVALMFLFTGSTHFTTMRTDYVDMVPESLPHPGLRVGLTGLFEILGAAALLASATREVAGLALVALLVVMLPANVHAARTGVAFRGRPPTPLGLRVPMQLVLVVVTLWASQAP